MMLKNVLVVYDSGRMESAWNNKSIHSDGYGPTSAGYGGFIRKYINGNYISWPYISWF